MKTIRFWLIAVVAVASVATTLALGFWQWGRAEQRLALHAAMQERANLPPLGQRELRGDEKDLLHRRVVLDGVWEAPQTVFLDNRQMLGRPGFYVVTPLRLANGDVILVQRGWAPRNFERREALPQIETPAGTVEVRGRLAPPPAKLYEFAGEATGPIRQNLDWAKFRDATRLPLLPLSVQQTGPASEGLLREWPQAESGAAKNRGYAFQWWAMSALIAFLYVWFQFVRARPTRQPR
ncbi:SURF1 family protein [Ramlibacter sp.]|uniref:SURF1 family protein n=1 Tax=Ramlibacter sp. TaxID=1917967 RepID=UPI003D0EF028